MSKQTAYLLGKEQSILTLPELTLLGSDVTCTVRLESTGISERHARIESRGTDYVIRDMRSTTGTFVNGARVLEAVLQDGDLVQVGGDEFTFATKMPETKDIGLSSKNENWSSQLSLLSHVAASEFPVLLLGPSGTGKEVLAEALHKNSSRSRGPFIRVNCSALTETLVESELFGHLKGSFTGAINDRKGAFEAARGGTLFLDEIGDLPYGLQAKILRALENNEIRPVGSDRTVTTDVRILAATHQNLSEKILGGEFRQDLYFRLSVITVTPPPLNERMEDFEQLLYAFAKQYKVRFSLAAINKLKKHTWPGNIRELKNTVARASAFFPKMQIEEGHVERIIDAYSIKQSATHGQPAPVTVEGQLPVIKEIEKQMIIKRLAANKGNQRRTASDLGMPKSTLHDRLRLYNIDPRHFVKQEPAEQTA
ncbi:MAG: sigma 54-interacting transcriptional regulator [Bdellovibrionaceae bacterium]|nr:sigma 54-interacting transcriptional regulator [Pseudobdellovibrionaceae bacterium]